MTSAFGKVILLGEHAVVYGHPALAAALEFSVTATARKSAGPTRIEVPAWGLAASALDLSPPGRALAAIAERLGALDGFAITCETDLPHGAGLGSSAALAVTTTRALAQAQGTSLSDPDVAAIANEAEVIFHDTPSGVDVALATHGGIGTFRRGEGFVPAPLAPLRLVIAVSEETRMTSQLVSLVRRARDTDASARDAIDRLGGLATIGASLLATAQLNEFGLLLTQAHRDLAGLGVSTPKLDALVAHALENGALGAKLTGAGGGGAIIAFAPGREEALVQSFVQAGHTAFVTRVGVVR